MTTTLYGAYGANLEIAGMARRCPGAQAMAPAWLENRALGFHVYATIRPQAGARVPLGIWRITERCERALDEFEDWPALYAKETHTLDVEGRPQPVMIYVMTDSGTARAGTRRPRKPHIAAIRRGYDDWGFDPAIIDEALD